MNIVRFLKIWICALLLLPLGACDFDDEPQTPDQSGGAPLPPEWSEVADRTLLIYMAADNSLGVSRFDKSDMDEMELAASEIPAGSRVIVYHDASSGDPQLLELSVAGWRHIKDYPGNESGVRATSPERMTEVFADMRSAAPARAYGLVLWSHGTGWDEQTTSRSSAPLRSFGQDYRGGEDRAGTTMSVPTLAGALDGQGFDFVYFDCCFMATVETAYELRHSVRYMVASATQLPANGMPYDLNLPKLAAASPDLIGAAANTFDTYDALSGTYRWCSIAVVDCSQLDALADATRAVMATATYAPGRPEVQALTTYSPCRVFEFGDYIEKSLPADAGALARWREALDRAVVYKATTPCIYEDGLSRRRIDMDRYCGLSSFVLESAADASTAGYSRLQWWQDVASSYISVQQ